MPSVRNHAAIAALVWTASAQIAFAQVEASPATRRLELSPVQLLDMADAAAKAGDIATATAAYRALTGNRTAAIRNEARFRLAALEAAAGRLTAAATLLRAVLDEQPDAQRVRLELARLLELLGDESGALRVLRAVQAGGLPPEVARLVDRYSAALRSRKPLGATLEVAVAPDSNINRATRSDTLGTVLGDFTLDEDARPRSGVGLALRGQTYARARIDDDANLIGRITGSADLYRQGQFNDVALGVAIGPEVRLGADRLSLEAGPVWRWYGGDPYARNWTFAASYHHPLGRRDLLRATASVSLIDNRRNELLDGQSYGVSLTWERALSQRAGMSVTLAGERQALADPAYALTAGQATVSAYREVGAMTLFGSVGIGRLVADARLLLLPERRSDRSYRASLGATSRRLQISGFAPLLRVSLERNRSSVEIYDYRRLRAELGFTRAF